VFEDRHGRMLVIEVKHGKLRRGAIDPLLDYPQSIAAPLFTRVFLIIIVTLCVTILPLCVPAATAQLTCTTSDLNFGYVVVGQSETQVVVLRIADRPQSRFRR